MLGSGIAQDRDDAGNPRDSHPLFRPHLMQGWSPDFIPRLTQDALDSGLVDEIVPVNGADALRLCRELAQKEGIFTGISGGATLAGALHVAKGAPEGSAVLCMLPDTGERYLSTPMFESVPVDMSPEELEISRSTPNYRFDAPAPAAAAAQPAPAAPADAVDLVRRTISDATQPVTLYALEWCEFCWSVRKMFARYEIPYRSIDLDSVAYQEGNLGGRIREALVEMTGARTIPQIFIGGQHVGGATDLFDAMRSGSLRELLDEQAIPYNRDVTDDPYTFLPGWLHAR